MQQRRRDEDEIARGNVIVLQLDLIGAAPGENARKFRFLVPVCADGRVQIVECGDIFLQWKKLFTVIIKYVAPVCIVLILISYVATPSIWTMVLGMAIKGWIEMARFIRNQILIIRDRDYNVASRCIGTPTIRIVLRNLLPYLVSVIMLRMALTIPEAIGNEVFITYIGLGLSVETPSLGNLVNDGRKVMMQAGLRYQLLYPTLILSFVTIAFYLIGNAFSDAADPKNHLQ